MSFVESLNVFYSVKLHSNSGKSTILKVVNDLSTIKVILLI